MSNWKDGFVDTNGIKIHYYRTGGDKPQVILNHGAMDDGLCWTRVAKQLEADYDVIMFDARGHGMSDSGEGDYTSASRAADLIGAIEALELDKPVIGGHSMGADTSIYAAALRPDLINGMYMEDPPVTFPGEPIFGGPLAEKGDDAAKMMVRIMGTVKVLPKFLSRIIAKKMMPVSPDDEITPWLNSKKRMSWDFLKAMTQPHVMESEATLNILEKIEARAMLIYGDRDTGAIVSHAISEEMSKRIDGLRVVHLAGANHDIRRAKFEGYMTALKSFLSDIRDN
ncbi:MAG: alpha/beta hydrolase [Chloroflexota bacterium]